MGNKKALWGVIAILTIALVANLSWQWSSGQFSHPIVAKVGTETVTLTELQDKLIERYGKNMLDEMVNFLVIEKEAEALGITVTEQELERELSRMKEGYPSDDDFARAIESELGIQLEDLRRELRVNLLLEKIGIKDVHIAEAETRAYYESHLELYSEPEKLHLRQIVVQSAEDAEQTLAELKGGADFATLAMERSTDVLTSSNGGELGFVAEDDPSIPYEIWQAAQSLKPGQHSGILPIEDQFILIQLVEKQEGRVVPYEEVKGEIEREMALSQVQPLPEVLNQLREKYEVETVDLRSVE